MRQEIWPRAVEDFLTNAAEGNSSPYGDQQIDHGPNGTAHQKEASGEQCGTCNDDRPSKCCQITSHFFHMGRANRIGEITRRAHGKENIAIQPMCRTFEDFIREFGETPDRSYDQAQQKETADFDVPTQKINQAAGP